MKATKHSRSSSFDPYSAQRFVADANGRKRASTDESDTSSSHGLGYNSTRLSIGPPRQAQLFATNEHIFKKGKYATTGGDRGFMAVFEYDVRGSTVMIDVDTSFVRFTSITQALGRSKVNFGRLVRSCPELEPHIHKLKGGYLSIQGTWLPYDLAKELSRRIAYDIREHLVPLFGYDFPQICLRPEDEGYGQLAIGPSHKRARKRHNNGGPHQTSCYGPAAPLRLIDGHLVEQAVCASSYNTEGLIPTSAVLVAPHDAWEWSTLPSSYATGSIYPQAPNTQYSQPTVVPSMAAPAQNALQSSLVPFFTFDSQAHHL